RASAGVNRSMPRRARSRSSSTVAGCFIASTLGVSTRDLVGNNHRILTDTEEQRRLALAQKVHADEVQPRCDRADAFFVQRESEVVERGDVDPARVVRTEAGGEY